MADKKIRFEDLGEPVQKLLRNLEDGYSDADLDLMHWVGVKDMVKIYNDLNEKKKAETIWKELKKQLKQRKEQEEQNAKEQEKTKGKIGEVEKEIQQAEEEAARIKAEKEAKKEKKRRKKEEKRLEAERLEREAEEEAAKEEAAAREAEEKAQAEADEEEQERLRAEKAARKAAREAKREAKRAERERQEEEEANRIAQEEAEEAEREAEARRIAKEKKRELKAQAAALKEREEDLRKKAAKSVKKSSAKTLREDWEKYVDEHPLEFGGDDEEIIQVEVTRNSKAPPKEFLKVKSVVIPDVKAVDEISFFQLEVRLHSGSKKNVSRRYNEFVEMKNKLGGTLDALDVPFPGKSLPFMKVKGSGLEKRRVELEAWINNVIEKLSTARTYAGVSLDTKQLRGDAARAEAERQRMQQVAVARHAFHTFCDVSDS